jgi:hypothetical protein
MRSVISHTVFPTRKIHDFRSTKGHGSPWDMKTPTMWSGWRTIRSTSCSGTVAVPSGSSHRQVRGVFRGWGGILPARFCRFVVSEKNWKP